MKPAKARRKSLREAFLEIAAPDELGHTKEILIEDLVKIDPRFATGNGGSWCRDDGPLRDYRIRRIKRGSKIVSVQLTGTREAPKERAINQALRKEITSGRCAILDVGSQIECDHKNGRYDSTRMADQSQQEASDFQPLCRAANMAKRQHCRVCKETGMRYDATRLGYSQGWLGIGTGDYEQFGCNGCYWHDPRQFNASISKKP